MASFSAEGVRAEAEKYFEKHKIHELFEYLSRELLMEKPEDPLEFLIDKVDNAPSRLSSGDEEEGKSSGQVGPEVLILHFGDVYHIDQRAREPVGGAARFVTTVKHFADRNPLVLFSGSAFNPSLMSTVTRGKQMVPVLNALGLQGACIGSRDLDHGQEALEKLASRCNFPWLCSNVTDAATGDPLCGAQECRLFEWHGVTVGLLGLVEREWLEAHTAVGRDQYEFADFVERGREVAQRLRREGADLVIALTHMRTPNDERLCAEVSEIDLVLGAHERTTTVAQIGHAMLVKSGRDFRELSALRLRCFRDSSGRLRPEIKHERIMVTSELPRDPEIAAVVDSYKGLVSMKLPQVIAESAVDMDGRVTSVRCRETNLCNMVADVARSALGVNAVLLSAGTFQLDGVIRTGHIRLQDLVSLLPVVDLMVVLRLSGRRLLSALEHGVAKLPARSTAFLQVSGVSFKVNPSCPAGRRVSAESLLVGTDPLDLDREYLVATTSAMAKGGNGYEALKDAPRVIDELDGPCLATLLRNHFTRLSVANGFRRPGATFKSSQAELEEDESLAREGSVLRLCPRVEGRIVIVE